MAPSTTPKVAKKNEKKHGKRRAVKAKITDMTGSKRKLSRFGKEQKKGMRGTAANYITRSRALKKLQITLKDFRRLCILKGIYPRDPKVKSGGHNQTYYYIKDVMHLAHEPLLNHFREFKTFMKKMTRAIGRKDISDAQRRENHKPTYELVHILKERYPRFQDAVGDLDDALCLVHLFSMMPASSSIPSKRTENCLKLVREWQNYLIMSRSLTKVFVSIKGIYYQAKILGQDVTWLVPHQFTPAMDENIDFRIMSTFLEFYEVLLKFVNFKLYTDMGICYPPKIDLQLDEGGAALRALVIERKSDQSVPMIQSEEPKDVSNDPDIIAQQQRSKDRLESLPSVMTGEKEMDTTEVSMIEPLEEAFASDELAAQIYKECCTEEKEKSLFSKFKFYLSREVPCACLEMVIRSFGGQVGWAGEGSPYDETSDVITHHVTDRPQRKGQERHENREYIQPQWIFDSCNSGMLLPVAKYGPGCALPPHLSPFVDDAKEGYVPEYRKQIDALKSAKDVLENADSDDEEREFANGVSAERSGIPYALTTEPTAATSDEDESATTKRALESDSEEKPLSKKSKKEKDDAEMKELAKNMMSKKAKRLYDRMQYGINKKSEKITNLEQKAKNIKKAKN